MFFGIAFVLNEPAIHLAIYVETSLSKPAGTIPMFAVFENLTFGTA